MSKKPDLSGPESPHFQIPADNQADGTDPKSFGESGWEEVEPGRFMPRRVRGSCQGRALG